MPAVKEPPRLTKGSKARKSSKRRLPKLLAAHRRREVGKARKAKRPRPPRLLQRQWRLKAREAAKKAAAEKQSLLAKWFDGSGRPIEAA